MEFLAFDTRPHCPKCGDSVKDCWRWRDDYGKGKTLDTRSFKIMKKFKKEFPNAVKVIVYICFECGVYIGEDKVVWTPSGSQQDDKQDDKKRQREKVIDTGIVCKNCGSPYWE